MINNQKRRWPIFLSGILGVVVMGYVLGPKPKTPDFTNLVVCNLPNDLRILEDSIQQAELKLNLKPDNEARIIWEAPYQKTPYSIVYLHGNGASQEEGDPIHEALAHRYGCNAYLARLEDHGIITDQPMLHMDAEKWMQSALDAIAIGQSIGEKVILVSCSTGSTLSLYLAAHFPELVEAQILMSPNIDYYDPRSFLMAWPWGLQISKFILDSDFYGWKAPGAAQQYWYTSYRVEELIVLKSILNYTMTAETFSKIESPVFMAYYYRDEKHQDQVVSVSRMKEMYSQLGTPDELKTEIALQNAGTHIISSDLFCHDLEELWTPLIQFCEQKIKLVPVEAVSWKEFTDIR